MATWNCPRGLTDELTLNLDAQLAVHAVVTMEHVAAAQAALGVPSSGQRCNGPSSSTPRQATRPTHSCPQALTAEGAPRHCQGLATLAGTPEEPNHGRRTVTRRSGLSMASARVWQMAVLSARTWPRDSAVCTWPSGFSPMYGATRCAWNPTGRSSISSSSSAAAQRTLPLRS